MRIPPASGADEHADLGPATLAAVCAAVDIAVVLKSEVSGFHINGAPGRPNPRKALIQLSDHQKKRDAFQLSLFHEISHLPLKSKKASYIHDDSEGSFIEDEANRFFRDLLMPSKQADRLKKPRTHAEIQPLADEIGVSASIVDGNTARDGISDGLQRR